MILISVSFICDEKYVCWLIVDALIGDALTGYALIGDVLIEVY